ncbi:hypothetical protein F4824DRAFT_507066 [Ustulina deusta]|nr:hypothetical protein F4824DRAFT_507066 [Ustulina deusta]
MASLACTACRAKKQRCDRRHACNAQTLGSLASTQTNTGGMLRRLQANQPHRRRADWLFDRGLPAGFLNAMQSRLRDTELALFRALAELYEGTVDGREYDGLSAGRLQTKSDMMEEWSSLPLRDRAQARAWFLSYRTGRSSPSAVQLDLQSETQSSSSSSPGGKCAQAGPGHGDVAMTPHSSRQVPPCLQSAAAPDSRPRPQDADTLAGNTTATALPLTSMASTHGDLGLSTRVKAIVESQRSIYF